MTCELIASICDDFDGYFSHEANRPYVGLTYETKTASSKSKTIGQRTTLLTSHSTTGGPNNIASRETQTTSARFARITSPTRPNVERAIPAILRTVRPRMYRSRNNSLDINGAISHSIPRDRRYGRN